MIIFQFFRMSRTKPENKSMSSSFICHAFGLRDYFYKTTRFIGGILTFEITPKPEAIKYPECDSRSVIKKEVIKRDLRTIPVGSKPVTLRTIIQRVWCPICHFVRQIKLSFSQVGESCTRRLRSMGFCWFIAGFLDIFHKPDTKKIDSNLG
jgi:hypothetical protein